MGEQVFELLLLLSYNTTSRARCTTHGECAAKQSGYASMSAPALMQEIMRHFEGDIQEGDVFAINDPYPAARHFPTFA